MENVSNLRGLQRQCVHVPCLIPSLCVCVCILMFVRNCLSVKHSIYMKWAKERSKRTELEKEQKNREKLACIKGCNLIY